MFDLLDRLAAMWNIYRVTRANVKIMNYLMQIHSN